MYECVSECMSVYHIQQELVESEETLVAQELDLVMSCYVGTGTQTQVFFFFVI